MKRKIKLDKLILFGINLLCIVVLVLGMLQMRVYVTALPDQRIADVWSAKDPYAQVTCVLTDSAAMTPEALVAFTHSMENQYTENSLKKASEEARMWVWCASGQTQLTIVSETAQATLTAYTVNGDYFPMELISGAYFSSVDVMNDYIILDQSAAWQLFGAYDIVGKSVTIGEKPYYVAGVVTRGNDAVIESVYDGGASIYISADSLTANNAATCLEVVSPEPVPGFTQGILEKALTADSSERVLIGNTTRYSFVSLVKTVLGFGKASIRTFAIAYPYWENAALIYQHKAAMLLVIMAIPLLVVLVTAIYWTIHAVKRGLKMLPKPAEVLDRLREKRIAREYKKKEVQP